MRANGVVSLLVTGRGYFRARLTCLALQHLRVSTIEEGLPRIAFIKVPDDHVLISFLTGDQASQVWAGVRARATDLITVRPGQSVCARTDRPCHWGAIWFPIKEFARYSRALTGQPIALPGVVCLWHPSPSVRSHLLRLHSAAIRAARTRWESLTTAEAAHGLEQQLMHALVECLAGTPVTEDTVTTLRHQDLAIRFEKLLGARPDGDLDSSGICAALGVSDRSLRRSCEQQLGMSPMSYLRLRRMQSVHRTLRYGVPEVLRVSDVAERYGFRNPGRFAGTYRDLFGELPSWTLRLGPQHAPRVMRAPRRAARRGPGEID
jgi:AraC-like DNA-binding protein